MTGPALKTEGIHASRIYRGAAEIAARRHETSDAGSARALAKDIRARVVRAWRWILGTRQQEALELATSMMHELDELDAHSAERYRVQLHLIRAVGKALSDDPEGLLLELDSPALAGRQNALARTLLRFGYWRLARWPELYELPMMRGAVSASHAVTRTLDLTILAATALERLQLVTASRFAADAMALANTRGFGDSIAAASAAAALGSVRYELGYLDHAEELMLSHLPVIRAQGTPDVVIRAYTLLSRIAQHRGQHEHAAFILSEGQNLGERQSCTRIVLAMMAERVNMLVAHNAVARSRQEVSAMRDYATTHPSPAPVDDEIVRLCDVADARVALAEGSPTNAVLILSRMLRFAEDAKLRHTAFRIALELAGALSATGEQKFADRLIVRALGKGERVGMLQCWSDAYPACGSHLSRIAERPPQAASPKLTALGPYLFAVLAHRDTSEGANQRIPRFTLRTSERLSARERAVLALVAKGQSNKRVARVLNVTPETIKSHLKRAFIKLGAKTRAEAVSRAGDLGQLIGVIVPTPHDAGRTSACTFRAQEAALQGSRDNVLTRCEEPLSQASISIFFPRPS
jgi:DNA-binding CsgD family transcriptional regulator